MAGGLAGGGRNFRNIGHIDLGIAGDRPAGADEDPAEEVEGKGFGHAAQARATTLSGRSVPNTRW